MNISIHFQIEYDTIEATADSVYTNSEPF
jgi:hypothetical protein